MRHWKTCKGARTIHFLLIRSCWRNTVPRIAARVGHCWDSSLLWKRLGNTVHLHWTDYLVARAFFHYEFLAPRSTYTRHPEYHAFCSCGFFVNDCLYWIRRKRQKASERRFLPEWAHKDGNWWPLPIFSDRVETKKRSSFIPLKKLSWGSVVTFKLFRS